MMQSELPAFGNVATNESVIRAHISHNCAILARLHCRAEGARDRAQAQFIAQEIAYYEYLIDLLRLEASFLAPSAKKGSGKECAIAFLALVASILFLWWVH